MIKNLIIYALILILVLAPWVIRNYCAFGVVTIDPRMVEVKNPTVKASLELKKSMKENRLKRQEIQVNPVYWRLQRIIRNYSAGDIELKILPNSIKNAQFEDNSHLKNKFFEYVLSGWELWRFYPVVASPYAFWQKLILGMVNGLVFIGGLAGAVLACKRFVLAKWIVLPIIALTAIHVYSGGPHARYILPVVPLMVTLTSFILVKIYNFLIVRKEKVIV